MKIQFKIKSTMVAALCSAVFFSSCGLMDTTSDEKLGMKCGTVLRRNASTVL